MGPSTHKMTDWELSQKYDPSWTLSVLADKLRHLMIESGHAIGPEITNGNFTFNADNKLLDSNYEQQTTGTSLHIKYSKALFYKLDVIF